MPVARVVLLLALAAALVAGGPARAEWVAVSPSGDASASVLAVAGTGNATCPRSPFCAAVSAQGSASACRDAPVAAFCVAAGGRDAEACNGSIIGHKCVALAAFGGATSCSGLHGGGLCGAASAAGDATSCSAREVDFSGLCVAASGTGDAASCTHAPGLKVMPGPCFAASGTGDASGTVAISATGHASGRVALSACNLLGAACLDPA